MKRHSRVLALTIAFVTGLLGCSSTNGSGSTGVTTSSGSTAASSSGSPPDSGPIEPDGGCGVPASFKWSSSGPLISAVSDYTHNLVAVKDPSVVFFDGKYHVYASDVDANGNYNMLYLDFTDFAQAGSATQAYLDDSARFIGYHAAPELFYFTPQKKWYLIFQSGPPTYSTTDDPTQPLTWTKPTNFFATTPDIVAQHGVGGGSAPWLDFWVICDDKNCHLFFEDDNGFLFRSQTPIDSFPNGFGDPVIVMQDSNPYNVFEASNVYKMKGTNQYLLIVEALGSTGSRYFRSWTADALDGTWTPLAATESNPFAGVANVSFGGNGWTTDISHGEMIRDDVDETLTIDTCTMRYLYQGRDPSSNGQPYNALPWKLGLLTQTN